jgi:hypothetical protein
MQSPIDQSSMAPHELVGLPELLERFTWLTERRVRSMVTQRSVRHWKIRGRLLFDPADFDAMVNAGYVAPRSDDGRGEAPPVAPGGASSRP